MGRARKRRGARGAAAKGAAGADNRAAGSTADESAVEAPARTWIQDLAEVIALTAGEAEKAFRTSLSAHVDEQRTTLFLPPEMPSLQPRSLRYLKAFAALNDCRLVEDRRQDRTSPVVEMRNGRPPALALGLALLLRQTGMPGQTALLSRPHRLAADSPMIDLPELIRMTAHALPQAKRVALLPNRVLVDVLHRDTQPIAGYGARINTAPVQTVLSHFDGPALRCIGYSTGRQYVMHMLLGGGPLASPSLWTHRETLTRTDLRFRLLRGRGAEHDLGLLYSTFYFDMAAQEPQPWWLTGAADLALEQATPRRLDAVD